MNYEKLSPSLAALMFEFFRFPEAARASIGKMRSQPLSLSDNNTLQTSVFIYCDEAAKIEDSNGLRVNSDGGEIRTAQIELEKISELSGRDEIRYLSCSRQLNPLNDFAAIEKELNSFQAENADLIGRDFIFGIIEAGIDASPQLAGGDDLSAKEIFKDFAVRLDASNKENIIVVKTDFQNAHIADAIRHIFGSAEKSGKKALVNLNLDNFGDVRKETGDLSNFIRQETGADKIVVMVAGNNEERKIEKTMVVKPGKFSPARFNFVVPSNSQPFSPSEVVLRGWIEPGGICEVSILSPGGGATRSTQTEVVAGNPTMFGNYLSSQAFLTKPIVAADGSREFFIDLRPIEPQKFVTGGTWKLTVTNVGEAETTVRLLSCVAANAKDAKFI